MDRRGWVEALTVGAGVGWVSTSYAQQASSAVNAVDRDPFLFAPSLVLLAQGAVCLVLRTAQSSVMPDEWQKAARTCSDMGAMVACFPSLALLSLLCGTLQDFGFAFRLTSLFFWTSCVLFARWALEAFQLSSTWNTSAILPLGIDVLDIPLCFAGVWFWAGSARAFQQPVMIIPEALSAFKVLPVWFAFCFFAATLLIRALLGRFWLRAFRKSFTPGEAVIVSHLLAIALADYVLFSLHVLLCWLANVEPVLLVKSEMHIVLQGGVLGVLCLAAVLSKFFEQHAVTSNETLDVNPREQSSSILARRRSQDWTPPTQLPLRATLLFYGITAIWLGVEVSGWVAALLGMRHPVIWVWDYTLSRNAHIWTLAYWVACLAVGLPLIHWIAGNLAWPLIITRKLYHLLALFMFGPACIFVPDFISLSFGIALALLLLVEYIRICRVPPFGFLAHSYLRSYTDSRDEGTTILTHIYLLLGCAVPLWMFPWNAHPGLPYASLGGLVVLGAGDAAGAIVGSTYGKVFLPGGRKTLEGSVSAVLSTWVCLSILATWQLSESFFLPIIHGQRIVAATLLTCVLEAFTKQIDNLTLPIFFSALLYAPFYTNTTAP